MITEFNNNISYLDLALLEMYNYYLLFNGSKDDEEKTICEILFRQRARNVSCELFIYEEKIKNVLREVLRFDFEKTKRDQQFYKQLELSCSSSDFGAKFYVVFKDFRDDKIVKGLRMFRNNEVHNRSSLLLYASSKNESENTELFDNLRYYLQELLKVKEIFEKYLQSLLK